VHSREKRQKTCRSDGVKKHRSTGEISREEAFWVPASSLGNPGEPRKKGRVGTRNLRRSARKNIEKECTARFAAVAGAKPLVAEEGGALGRHSIRAVQERKKARKGRQQHSSSSKRLPPS